MAIMIMVIYNLDYERVMYHQKLHTILTSANSWPSDRGCQ